MNLFVNVCISNITKIFNNMYGIKPIKRHIILLNEGKKPNYSTSQTSIFYIYLLKYKGTKLTHTISIYTHKIL